MHLWYAWYLGLTVKAKCFAEVTTVQNFPQHRLMAQPHIAWILGLEGTWLHFLAVAPHAEVMLLHFCFTGEPVSSGCGAKCCDTPDADVRPGW
jgi:hypothetical protein